MFRKLLIVKRIVWSVVTVLAISCGLLLLANRLTHHPRIKEATLGSFISNGTLVAAFTVPNVEQVDFFLLFGGAPDQVSSNEVYSVRWQLCREGMEKPSFAWTNHVRLVEVVGPNPRKVWLTGPTNVAELRKVVVRNSNYEIKVLVEHSSAFVPAKLGMQWMEID